MTIKKIILTGFGIAALLISLVILAIYFLVRMQLLEEKTALIQAQTQSIASGIALESKEMIHWAEAQASNPQVIQSLQQSKEQQNILAAQLENQLQGILKVRILTLDVNLPDTTQTPHMSFADLELVEKAKTGNPAPAIIQLNSAQEHIGIARAIKQSDQLLGVLLVSYAHKHLTAYVKQLSPKQGAIALYQETNKLISAGETALTENTESGSQAIMGTPWKLRYWNPATAGNGIMQFIIAFASSLFLLGLLCMLTLKKLQGMFAADVATLKQLTTDSVQGSVATEYPFKFDLFADLLKHARLLNIREVSNDLSMEVKLTSEEEQAKEDEERGNQLMAELDAQMKQADNLLGDLGGDSFDLQIKQAEDKNPTNTNSGNAISQALPLATGIPGMIGKQFKTNYLNAIGQAFGSETQSAKIPAVFLSHDGSTTAQQIASDVSAGLLASGANVQDAGHCPAPVTVFATHSPNNGAGITINSSLPTAQASKLKLIYDGRFISNNLQEAIDQRIKTKQLEQGLGVSSNNNPTEDYIGAIADDIHLDTSLKIVIQSSNAVVGKVAQGLFQALDCETIQLQAQVTDGELFDPLHLVHLEQLSSKVLTENADIGFSFDDEATRLGVVTSEGKIIWQVQLMMLFAEDLLLSAPGTDILFDRNACPSLAKTISRLSGKLISNASNEQVFATVDNKTAPLAGNMQGQFVFADRWLHFPDALYAGARFIEILSTHVGTSQQALTKLPDYFATQTTYTELNAADAAALVDFWVKMLIKVPHLKFNTDAGLKVELNNGLTFVDYDKEKRCMALHLCADSQKTLDQMIKLVERLNNKSEIKLKLPF